MNSLWLHCTSPLMADFVAKVFLHSCSFRCTRDFRVKMWGTSSPEDKLAGDLGNVIEAISNRRSLMASASGFQER